MTVEISEIRCTSVERADDACMWWVCTVLAFFCVQRPTTLFYPRGIMIFWFPGWMIVLRRLRRIQQGRSQALVCQVSKLVTPKHLAGERQGNGILVHGCRFGDWPTPRPSSGLRLFSDENLGCVWYRCSLVYILKWEKMSWEVYLRVT